MDGLIHTWPGMLAVFFSLIVALNWGQFLGIFQLDPVLGPLLHIFNSMAEQIAIFMICEGLVVVIFACMGRFMFFENEAIFKSYIDSMLYLFSAGVAELDFSDMVVDESSNYNKRHAQAYLLIFTIISHILFLNLLIAILTNVYSSIKTNSVGLYLN